MEATFIDVNSLFEDCSLFGAYTGIYILLFLLMSVKRIDVCIMGTLSFLSHNPKTKAVNSVSSKNIPTSRVLESGSDGTNICKFHYNLEINDHSLLKHTLVPCIRWKRILTRPYHGYKNESTDLVTSQYFIFVFINHSMQ